MKHSSTLILAIILWTPFLLNFNLVGQSLEQQRLSGYVYAQGFPGHTLSNTEVVLTNVWTKETKTAYTDSKGYYELSLNATDTYTIAAHKYKYTSMVMVINLSDYKPSLNVEQDIPIELPVSATRLSQKNCVLQGKVRLETENQSSVPNVRVVLLDTETQDEHEVITDQSGFFQFSISHESDVTLYAFYNSTFSEVKQMKIQGCTYPQKVDLYLHTAESTNNKELTRLVNHLSPKMATHINKENTGIAREE